MSLVYFPIIVSVFALAFVWFLVSQNKKASNAFAAGLIPGLATQGFALLAISLAYLFAETSWLVGVGFVTWAVYFFASAKKFQVLSADVLSTYSLAIIATMILGALSFPRSQQFVLLPMVLASVAILTTIIGILLKKKVLIATIVLSVVAFYPIISKLMANLAISVNNLFLSALVGFAIAVGMFFVTEYFASKPNKIGAVAFPALLIAFGAVVSFWLADIYGVALMAFAMISFSAIVGAVDAYAIVSVALTCVALFLAYSEKVDTSGTANFLLNDIKVIAGLLIGGLLPYLFISVKKMLLSALIPLLAPILIGIILGPQALGGVLVGSIVTGLFVGVAINPLIKGLCIVALLIISFLV